MDDQQILQQVILNLRTIAPEITPDTIQTDQPLRDQIDLDSMDFLNFIISLHKTFAIDIPEADYAQLGSLDAIVAYIRSRRAA